MKVTILGCGPSYGIPNVACGFGGCDFNEPKNMRMRSSILLQEKQATLLFDTSPDLRQQLFAAKVQHIDAVVWTHMHADHTAGIDDLRPLAFMHHQTTGNAFAFEGYLAEWDKEDFDKRFSFYTQPKWDGLPLINLHTLLPGKKQQIQGLDVLPIEQTHGRAKSLGFRIGDFAYNTDFSYLSEESLQLLEGVKVWVVACHELHSGGRAHLSYFDVMELIKQIKPERAYLTHMGQNMDYVKLSQNLPPNVQPAYDGLVIDI